MTRKEARELLPLIQAYAEGKTIQRIDDKNEWIDLCIVNFDFSPNKYRIKPKSKYRPFKSQEECWNEMLKHQSLGWVRYDDLIIAIQNIAPEGITVNDGIKTSNFYFEECLMNMKFADGTPFGIKE